ncbi:MAG: multicopper oxidase domain-containing protein [Desulfuromonadaceae bacterium]
MIPIKRKSSILGVMGVVLAAALALTPVVANGQGTPLPGSKIPQFVDPLPLLSAAGGSIETITAGTGEITLNMFEFKANMLPSTFKPATGNYSGTWVFGYRQGPLTAPPATAVDTYFGPFIVATRGTPTQIRYVNNLTDNNIFWREWTDKSLHSAFHQVYGFPMAMLGDTVHYPGPIPAVPHLHGGEDAALTDGGPEAWFLSDQGNVTTPPVVNTHGEAYYTMAGVTALPNEAVYRYPNSQEAAPLWFHDHLLGGTRINATFAGLAGGYAIKDDGFTLPAGMDAVGLKNTDGTNMRYSVPMVLQDRMFDTNGQLFFPNVGINPTAHPYWIPEFVGDTIVVNGKVWPYMNVDQQRYRFYIVNGSNSRPYQLFLQDQATGVQGPPMWIIATDGGYLDNPILLDPNASGTQKKAGALTELTVMPGERYEIIVDFNDTAWKARLPKKASFPRNLILRNIGATVNGLPNVNLDGRVMQFRVSATIPTDTSYNPAGGTAIRGTGQTIKRLVNTATGALVGTADKTRELVLVEIGGPGGPLEVMLNNTSWDGIRANGTTLAPVDGATLVQNNYVTEFPIEGETEVWEIVNTTMDRHPIHLHGVQFQILNRQVFNGTGFRKAYDASFPGATVNSPLTGLPVTYPAGVFIPDFGPPLSYAPSIASGGKYGGNPDVTPYLKGAPAPQLSYEVGWKDTAIMNPGEVTRIAVRFAPYAYDDNNAFFPYNPSALNGYYVWHCHITDHEDNEMMRPTQFVPNTAAVRTFIQGTDY